MSCELRIFEKLGKLAVKISDSLEITMVCRAPPKHPTEVISIA